MQERILKQILKIELELKEDKILSTEEGSSINLKVRVASNKGDSHKLHNKEFHT
jgi:hypothetical protein